MEVKIRATFSIKGAKMYDNEVAEKENLYNQHIVKVFDEKKKKWKTYNVNTRQAEPAKQVISMSKEAYNYFVGSENPVFIKKRDWGRMSKNQKLKAHLNNIAESLDAILLDFDVFED